MDNLAAGRRPSPVTVTRVASARNQPVPAFAIADQAPAVQRAARTAARREAGPAVVPRGGRGSGDSGSSRNRTGPGANAGAAAGVDVEELVSLVSHRLRAEFASLISQRLRDLRTEFQAEFRAEFRIDRERFGRLRDSTR